MKSEQAITRPFFRKTDWNAIALILLLALGFWGFWIFSHKTDRLQIEIYSDNRLLQTISLPAQDISIPIPDKNVTLELRDNAICFSETDCPDKTCSKAGFISQSGQTAICLPNRILVKIVGAYQSPSEADGIAG